MKKKISQILRDMAQKLDPIFESKISEQTLKIWKKFLANPSPKRTALYICLEGTEGVGKTTQVTSLVNHFKSLGLDVLETKEPGTAHLPLTQKQRAIYLDASHNEEMTLLGREYVAQSIRSIHLEKLILPALSEVDVIIQDRGLLSGLAYALGCGVDYETMNTLCHLTIGKSGVGKTYDQIYSHVIYLQGNVKKNLQVAAEAKQEFSAGDAMESKGSDFMEQVGQNFITHLPKFNGVVVTTEDENGNKFSKEEVTKKILEIVHKKK